MFEFACHTMVFREAERESVEVIEGIIMKNFELVSDLKSKIL